MQQTKSQPVSQAIQSNMLTPLYSPRTTYSNHIKEIQQLKVNLTINIDKYILGNLKNQFEKRSKEITQIQFMHFANKYLKDWNLNLEGRQVKINECLLELWSQIDIENAGKVNWEEFNTKIIQTGLNIKTLSNTTGVQPPIFKEQPSPIGQSKYESCVAKMVYIEGQQKVAYFRQESIKVDFFSTDSVSSKSQQSKSSISNHTKSILLPQQDLKVQTLFKVKNKANHEKPKVYANKMVKKDVVVSSYKNIVVDILFINDKKYKMLLVSCSDKYVRGYDISSQNPVITTQPQNQDEAMVHQFPVEIYTMTWDPINQTLYAAGKNLRIYQWMVKTDSERELYDPYAHQKMISTMLMMPKLQLLATGGFDGKMILWDSVSQAAKCKYEQHTRAISSIAFHDSLILLFTASYDHKICVWNPYISSLIHKIDNNLNILFVEIVPNTNYLLSVDAGGNVKVRQMNRFTQIASFCIFRSQNADQNQNYHSNQNQKQTGISVCSTTSGPLNYYFGTQRVYHFEYIQLEKSSIKGNIPLDFEVLNDNFLIYVPIKSNMVLQNMLTGTIYDTLYDITESQITTFGFFKDLGFLVLGDLNGSLSLRKIKNGKLIRQLCTLKSAVYKLKTITIARSGQKQSKVKKTYYIIAVSQDGQVSIFRKHSKQQFEPYKEFNIRKDFNEENVSNIVNFQYMSQKNILVILTANQQVIFIDVEKKTLLSQFRPTSEEVIDFFVYPAKSIMLSITKEDNIIGTFLPPSSRKYKKSCQLQLKQTKGIEKVVTCSQCKFVYVATQFKELMCFEIKEDWFGQYSSQDQSIELKPVWKVLITQRVKKMTIIQEQQILILLSIDGDLFFISSETGESICLLKSDRDTIASLPEPIFYLKQQTKQVYVPTQDQYYLLNLDDNYESQVNLFINPSFYSNWMRDKNLKSFNRQSNPRWNLTLRYQQQAIQKINKLISINKQIKSSKSKIQSINSTATQKKINKAIQLQKKWDKQKQEYQEDGSLKKTKKVIEEKPKKQEKKIIRGSSLGSLHNFSSYTYSHKKNISKDKKSMFQSRKQTIHDPQTHLIQDILKDDPLFRLGNALRSINNSDTKAQSFINMAKHKGSLKLPKIGKLK